MLNRLRTAWLLCTVMALSACGGGSNGSGGSSTAEGSSSTGVAMTRDDAAGAPFQAPGPRSCPDSHEPSSGPIGPEQARAYVICSYEHADQDTLLLLTNVQVQVGEARPYNPLTDFADAVDTAKQVYDIRGNSIGYSCSARDMSAYGVKRCGRNVYSNNEGRCYQTTFGEWRCTWNAPGFMGSTDTRLNVDPPALSEAE